MQYIVSRSSGDEPIVLTIDRQPTDISFKTGMVFGADIYSQNEVETIADCKASQLALLDKFQADSIAEIESRIDHITSQLAANANQIVPVQQRIAALTDELATLASVEEKLARFGAAGGQDAATINKAHNLKALRDREHRIARSGYQALVQYKDELEGCKGRLVQSSASLLDREVATGPNGQMVQDLLNVVSQCGVAIDLLLQDAKGKISDAINQVTAMGTRLTTTHRQQEMEFQALIEKHQEAQGQAAERAKLERLRNELLAKQRQKQQHIEQLGNLESSRQNLIRQLSEQRDERFAVREAIVKNINSNLAPAIRVSISQNGNPERYQRILEDGLKNARVKHGIVAQKIVDAFVPWDLVVALRRRDSRFGTPGKPTPIRLRSRTRQRVGVSGSWNCWATAGSCAPPASRPTWDAASRPSNASSKPSAWPERSSSSVPTKPGLISWWERECDHRSAKIQRLFGRTSIQRVDVI